METYIYGYKLSSCEILLMAFGMCLGLYEFV